MVQSLLQSPTSRHGWIKSSTCDLLEDIPDLKHKIVPKFTSADYERKDLHSGMKNVRLGGKKLLVRIVESG